MLKHKHVCGQHTQYTCSDSHFKTNAQDSGPGQKVTEFFLSPCVCSSGLLTDSISQDDLIKDYLNRLKRICHESLLTLKHKHRRWQGASALNQHTLTQMRHLLDISPLVICEIQEKASQHATRFKRTGHVLHYSNNITCPKPMAGYCHDESQKGELHGENLGL